MNHRRRKAMRFEQLLWLSTQSQRELVSYLINTSLPKSGIPACISSRITTVIQVVRYHQINHNWFNEPFAVSQYKSLILRHAWLNLWDKHMTTGRINQVSNAVPSRETRRAEAQSASISREAFRSPRGGACRWDIETVRLDKLPAVGLPRQEHSMNVTLEPHLLEPRHSSRLWSRGSGQTTSTLPPKRREAVRKNGSAVVC